MSYYNQPGGYQQPPYQGQPPPQGYGQPPQQGYNQQYPPQGYPPQQGWGQQPPPAQYNPPPPGQYGAPPPGQYGQPHGQYPPQGQFQQPPPGNFGAPPHQYGTPQGQYGAPPSQGQWGQPPPQQPYGAPPPGQFASPAPGGHFGGPPAQASPGYGQYFAAQGDFTHDVDAIRKAMKGFGTDEKALINLLSKKDPIQINTIRNLYEQRHHRNLVGDLKGETSGYFEEGLVQIGRGPLDSDCYNLMEAMKGLGTKEVVLDDVLVGRSNADITAIKTRYHELFKRTLEADLRGDLSAGTEQMFMMIISGRRTEEATPVNPQEIEHITTELQNNMGGFAGKNATRVCEILTSKSDTQLRAIIHAYNQRYHKSLDAVIKSAFSGHMEDALRLLVARANNRAEAEAMRLEDAMAGLGTKDSLLVQRVVRCHWDRGFMNAVSNEFKKLYKRDLVKRIEGETRGDYEKLMVACVKS